MLVTLFICSDGPAVCVTKNEWKSHIETQSHLHDDQGCSKTPIPGLWDFWGRKIISTSGHHNKNGERNCSHGLIWALTSVSPSARVLPQRWKLTSSKWGRRDSLNLCQLQTSARSNLIKGAMKNPFERENMRSQQTFRKLSGQGITLKILYI